MLSQSQIPVGCLLNVGHKNKVYKREHSSSSSTPWKVSAALMTSSSRLSSNSFRHRLIRDIMHFPRACLPEVLSDCIRVQNAGRGFSFLACLNFSRLLSSSPGTFRLCPPGRFTELKSFSSVKRIRSTVFCTSLSRASRTLCSEFEFGGKFPVSTRRCGRRTN